MLKPQDTLLALKYWSIKSQGYSSAKQGSPAKESSSGPDDRNLWPSVRQLAESIKISPGEISKSAKRLLASKLLVHRKGVYLAEKSALKDWLCYGVRYAYPVENAGYGRGTPTAWNCPLIESEIVPPTPPVVWPVSGGAVDGSLIRPIHESVSFAASNDQLLYEALSLVEAIRLGKPRELKIAREQLSNLLER